MAWVDNKKWVSHSLLSPHSKLSACNFVMYHPRLACNWRFQQISVCFWGYSCTMPMFFLHTTDPKVISRHAVPKYRLGQHGMGRHIEWALYTFSLSFCTQLRLDLRHTTHADDLLIHKLIQFTGGTIWHGGTVRNGLGSHALLSPIPNWPPVNL